jgi:TonB C terminal
MIGGIFTSIVIHLCSMALLMWGGHRHHDHLPNIQGAGASPHRVTSLDSMLVVFEDDSAAIHDALQDGGDTNYRFILPDPPLPRITRIQIPEPDPTLIERTDERNPAEADGDSNEHSLLFGRYIGQISARVERAWIRPRATPASGGFACRVEITQDDRGNVREVVLKQCTDQPQWQVSLVQAIQQASPFPAPPDPAVFSNLLTMEFDSDPYIVGGSEQGFEPAAKIAGSGAVESVSRQVRPDGSVNLTIVGTHSSADRQ